MQNPCCEPPPPLLTQGIALLNVGEYFDQHELLEQLWCAETRPVRALYQGILQIGVAFYHLHRGNYHGTVALLERGLRRVAPFAPSCQGVDVADLVTQAQRARDAVEALGPTGCHRFDWCLAPRIRMLE